jgi:hypothetical protein
VAEEEEGKSERREAMSWIKDLMDWRKNAGLVDASKRDAMVAENELANFKRVFRLNQIIPGETLSAIVDRRDTKTDSREEEKVFWEREEKYKAVLMPWEAEDFLARSMHGEKWLMLVVTMLRLRKEECYRRGILSNPTAEETFEWNTRMSECDSMELMILDAVDWAHRPKEKADAGKENE